MTDQELKDLVASLAQESKKTDEQLRQTDVQLRQTDEQLRQTGVQLCQTDEQLRQTDEQLRKTDDKILRMEKKLEHIGLLAGNIANNQGAVAEEYFLNSLMPDLHLGDIYFDDITQGMRKHRGAIQEEYDLFMSNGNTAAVIEVKYRVHMNDIEKLERKMNNFKKLFPLYESFKVYGAMAGFQISDDIKKELIARGYFVLERKGEMVQSFGKELRVL